MCPLLLNSFAVRPPNTFREVEGVIRLAGGAMTRKVKFRDQVRELEVFDIQVWVVLGKTLKMVDRPFAGNVIRNHNIANGNTFQYGRDDIICVDEPRRLSEDPHQILRTYLPFSLLQVASTILHHEGVPCTDTSNDT